MDKSGPKDSKHWTSSLVVGVDAIDEDHNSLFKLFNEARLIAENKDSDKLLLIDLAQKLLLYTKSHFSREEVIMAASAYPGYDEHREIHQRFLERVQLILDETIRAEGSLAEFIFALEEQFVSHIKDADVGLAKYTAGFENEVGHALLSIEPLSLPDKINIYVVDDEPQQVELMIELIDVAGLSAIGYTSALLLIEQRISNADIILLDLNMPDIDGIEVMRMLYDKGCSPTFILISGFDERVLHSARQFAEAKNLEVATTYCKPIDSRKFIEEIGTLYAEKTRDIEERRDSQPARSVDDGLSVDELKTALKEHQFVLYYQPQVDIQTGELRGFEALVRLQHPEQGLVYPDQFIGLAEANDMMPELTHEVFNLAVDNYQAFQKINGDPKHQMSINVSINVSAQDLDLEMPERLAELLIARDIPADLIMIELTETALRTSLSDSLDILNRLRMKGFSLSIDDFGTGYSSLVQLYKAPFTELKIDLQFVMRMLEDKEAHAIVKICILLAKELKLETVAEGVESEDVLNELAILGCDIAQGYHIARPMPFAECSEWYIKYQQQLDLDA